MPVYEFCCDDCNKKFDLVATLQEKEAGLKPACPYCGSTRVHQVFGRFTVIGGSKTDIDADLPEVGDEELGTDEFGDEELDDFEDVNDNDFDEGTEEDIDI
ncbi:MAG: FmdB family zinc ribbon protein [candidate division WOR-3 bacterium]